MLLNRLLPPAKVMFTVRGHLSTNLVNELNPVKNNKVIIERTITEDDVSMFSKITGDSNEIHISTKERRGIVHGALLNGIVSGVIGTKLPGHGSVVISQTLNFPNPCYVGDTVIVTVETESVRKILTCKYQIVNKGCKSVVMEGAAKVLYRPKSC